MFCGKTYPATILFITQHISLPMFYIHACCLCLFRNYFLGMKKSYVACFFIEIICRDALSFYMKINWKINLTLQPGNEGRPTHLHTYTCIHKHAHTYNTHASTHIHLSTFLCRQVERSCVTFLTRWENTKRISVGTGLEGSSRLAWNPGKFSVPT